MENDSIFWSYSRWQLFNHCERAYYYQYCAQKENASNSLKSLSHRDALLSIILHDSLMSYFHENKGSRNHSRSTKEFLKLVYRLYKTKFLSEPQGKIYELYYGEQIGSVQDYLEQSYNRLYNTAMSFCRSSFFQQLNRIPYLAFKWLPSPVSITHKGIDIWTRPMLIWQEDGILYMACLPSSFKETPLNIQFTVNALLAHYNYFIELDAIVLKVFFLDSMTAQEFRLTEDMIRDVEKIMALSHTEMLTKQSSDPIQEMANCRQSLQCKQLLDKQEYIQCKFKTLCHQQKTMQQSDCR